MLQPNTVVGRYEIQRRVARGGMGTLYLAQDPVLGRPVALKLFLSDLDLPEARERFMREARAAAALNHPHIVTIYDYGEFQSQPYMVLEFIDGETLASLIRRGTPIPIVTKLRWLEELCAAVEYAHAHGVIHRDIKPLNLMVDKYGRLKVLDFGIARMRGSLASHGTARIGTAGYTAPEQIRGGNVDPRSDLFSIGVVAYELLSYVEPFGSDIEPAITSRILEQDPRPLQEVNPEIDADLAGIVWTALRKEPSQRLADAESMRAMFEIIRRRVEALSSDTGVTRFVLPRSHRSEEEPPASPTPRRLLSEEGRPTPGVMPTDRRAERDAIVKKRIGEIQDALKQAREFLTRHELDAARAQCERVLVLDKAHPEALDIKQRIEAGLGREQAAALLTDGHRELERGAVTKAMDLLQKARALSADHPEVPALDRAVRIARSTQEVAHRRVDPRSGPVERKTADRGTGELPGVAHPPDAPTISQTRQPARSPIAWLRDANWAGLVRDGDATVIRPWQGLSKRRQILLVGSAITLVVVTGLVLWLTRGPALPGGPLPMVDVFIDAVPWATITEIRGENAPEPYRRFENETTPLTVQLPPGTYVVSLIGPSSEATTITVVVQGTARIDARTPYFPIMTVQEYFGFYLDPAQPGSGR